MTATAYDPNNILVGVGKLYYAADGAEEPETLEETPDPTIWKPFGWTDGGVTLTITPNTTSQTVDQEGHPVIVTRDEETVTVGFSLAEPTMEVVQAVNGGGTILVGVAGGVQAGTRQYRPSKSKRPTFLKFLYDGDAPGDGGGAPNPRRRVILRRVSQTDAIAIVAAKTDKQLVPATFTAQFVSPSIDAYVIIEHTDDGT